MPRAPSHGIRIGLERLALGSERVTYALGLAFPEATLEGKVLVELVDGRVSFEGLPESTPEWARTQVASLLRAAWVARTKEPGGTLPRRIERWRPGRA